MKRRPPRCVSDGKKAGRSKAACCWAWQAAGSIKMMMKYDYQAFSSLVVRPDSRWPFITKCNNGIDS